MTPIDEAAVSPPTDAYNVVTISVGDRAEAVRKRLEALKKGVKVVQGENDVGGVRSLSSQDRTDETVPGDSYVGEDIDVSFTGPPGAEVVYGVEHSQTFPKTSSPSVDTVRGALVTKYGQPLLVQHESEQAPWYFVWIRPIDPSKPVNSDVCVGQENASAADKRAANCGTTLVAEVQVQVNEPKLATILKVQLTGGAPGDERLAQWTQQQEVLRLQQLAAKSERAVKDSDSKAARPSL